MANITIFNAVDGEAFSIQIIDGSSVNMDAGWLARLTSTHLPDVGLPDPVQWSFPVPGSHTLVIERVVDKSRPRFQVDFLPDGTLVAIVTGSNAEQVGDERESWWKALSLAIEAMSTPPPNRQWDCLIGPIPIGQHVTYRLKGPMSVGGIRIPQPVQKMTETAPGFRYGILLNNGHASWPIMASGTYSSWEEEGIPDEPMANIQSLCLVLSLAMDQPWGPRHNPMGRSDHHLVIPRFADSAKHMEQWEVNSEPNGDGEVDIDLRRWCKKAWEALKDKRNRKIKNAMGMYLDGMILEGSHQTFARLAYVSAIEALRDGNLDKCETCGQEMGITQKYRETVESAGMNFVEDVYGPHYSFRSRTVHDAILDPEDSRWGQHFINWGPDHGYSDLKRKLWLLREKVRSLILDRLGLQDPLTQIHQ